MVVQCLILFTQLLTGGTMVAVLESIGAKSGLELNNAAPQPVPRNNAGMVTTVYTCVCVRVMYERIWINIVHIRALLFKE